MVWMRLLLLAVIFGCVQSQLTCPDVFCLSQPTTCTCQLTGGVLAWSIQYPNGTIVGSTSHVRGASQFVLNTQYPLADVVNNDVPFSSTLTNTTNPVIIADLSFTVDMSYNGYRIVCSDGVNPLTETISILDPPGPTSTPHSLSFAAINFSSANLTWDISSVQQCLTGYQLVINGSEIINISSVPAVGSESYIINDRTRGIQYCYTVSVVDTGNRTGPSSDSQCFTLDTPLRPEITWRFDFPESDDTVNVIVNWMQPASSRPPVLIYIVVHNINDNGDFVSTEVLGSSPTITIGGATLGSAYSMWITPSNTLGNGTAAYTNIIVPSMIPQSDFPGWAVAVIVVAIIIIVGITILIVICVVIKMKNKRNKSSNEKGQVTEMNYANVVHSTSSQGRKPVTSSRNQTKPAQEEPVMYSAVQSQSPQREAGPGGLVYADVSHSVSSRSNPKADSIGRVEYTSLQETARN